MSNAENTRSFFMGEEAAMTAGAGVAVTRDAGCLWYNPANHAPKAPLEARLNRYGLNAGLELKLPLKLQGMKGERTLF